MTSKKAIKRMMAVGIPRDTARLWSDVGTAFRLTNETVAMMAIHCEGRRPTEISSVEVVIDAPLDGFRVLRIRRRTAEELVIV
nr:MAG TPA: hypothetical protein [Caudoviricetes sp.]